VVEIAAAACWSPRAAAACARDRLIAPLPLAASAEAGSSTASTMHKIKRMMDLFFCVTREGVFRMHRARAFPARLGCGALHRQRFAPLSRPQVEPTPQRARPICPASVSAPKAGRPINTSMSGSKPKPVPCSETSSMARKCPARVHRERVHGRSSLAYPVTASSPTSETSRAPMLPVTMLCKSGR